jgi:hypothetical protein
LFSNTINTVLIGGKMDGLIARAIIDHKLFNPDGVAGKITINLNNKPIIFHFEMKLVENGHALINISRKGKTLFYSRTGTAFNNINLLTEDERMLAALLTIAVTKVVEAYENGLEDAAMSTATDSEFASVELDILPTDEKEQRSLIGLLEGKPEYQM